MEEVDGPAVSLVDLLHATADAQRLPHPDLSSATAQTYLDHLVSLPLPQIVAEPPLISSEASSVESELTNLCFREYPTFISVHKCSSAVSSAFDDFSGSLGRLLDAVPALEEECRSFATSTTGIQVVRGRAALVQEHQDKLLDLLEIPQLMDTCVRNGYYHEAMELAAHTETLVKRYGSIPLVEDVAKEVEGVLHLMLSQLLTLLRQPVKLPTLVKAVGFLRRLGSIDEPELGLAFLASRLVNFRAQLVQIERDRAEPIRYVRKYVDLFREHVYDIISQFSAIFLDSSSGEQVAHLTSFAHQCVTDLIELVGSYIPRIASDSASMSSILVQLGYCAMSFARVGMDFSSLVTEPFSHAVLSSFSLNASAASTALATTLRSSAKAATNPSLILVAPYHIPAILASPVSPPQLALTETDQQPPSITAHFPPLAQLINSHVNSLNSLRLLAPLQLRPQLVAIQISSLLTSTTSILQFVQQAGSAPEMPNGLHSRSNSRDEVPILKHTRTPSEPRAQLLRRNSETQLTPDQRTARRREARRVCVAFADVWIRAVIPFLMRGLEHGVYQGTEEVSKDGELEAKTKALQEWIEENGEQEQSVVNGNAHHGVKADETALMQSLTILEEEEKSNGPSPIAPTSEVLIPPPTLEEIDPAVDTPALSVDIPSEDPALSEAPMLHSSPLMESRTEAGFNADLPPALLEPTSSPIPDLPPLQPDSPPTAENHSPPSPPASTATMDSMFAPVHDAAQTTSKEQVVAVPLPLELELEESTEEMDNEMEAVENGVAPEVAAASSNSMSVAVPVPAEEPLPSTAGEESKTRVTIPGEMTGNDGTSTAIETKRENNPPTEEQVPSHRDPEISILETTSEEKEKSLETAVQPAQESSPIIAEVPPNDSMETSTVEEDVKGVEAPQETAEMAEEPSEEKEAKASEFSTVGNGQEEARGTSSAVIEAGNLGQQDGALSESAGNAKEGTGEVGVDRIDGMRGQSEPTEETEPTEESEPVSEPPTPDASRPPSPTTAQNGTTGGGGKKKKKKKKK
ncbi:conserved oligomeric Golgi complex subunit 8, partial [Tremellales sp. Uapishka_1]